MRRTFFVPISYADKIHKKGKPSFLEHESDYDDASQKLTSIKRFISYSVIFQLYVVSV
jgi:hypothetical protein